MHRQLLLGLLGRYQASHPDQRECAGFVRRFVEEHADCFERSCAEAHVTGSAWILSSDYRRVLLTRHRKLGRWLQLGGHADGDPDPLRVALREAREESGMQRFERLPAHAEPELLDVDVHEIPAFPGEPAHLHLDVRFLLVAAADQPLRVSDESHELRWVDRDGLEDFLEDESQLRMERHARRWLGGGLRPPPSRVLVSPG